MGAMNARTAAALLPALLTLASRADPPTARPTPQQLAWQRMELTMFCHFGVNTFTDREWGDGKEDPAIFTPSALDCRQWARAAKDAGVRLMILTAKHHDGFCLWPSKHTEHSVKNSPWRGGKGDVVREFTDACRAEGLAVGLYLSPWDRHEASYGTDAYNDHFCAQLEELLTGYGPVAEVWFDGACGEGPNGKKQVYDFPRWYALIRRLQPEALIAICGPDIRWVGNESGVAREGESSVRDDGRRWYPAECDVSIRPGWFYHPGEDARVKPLTHLMDIYFKSVGRNSGLLLNVPPDRRGLFADPDVARLREFGAAVRSLYATNLLARMPVETAVSSGANPAAATDDRLDTGWTPEAPGASWIEWRFPEPRVFNLANLREDIRSGERVRRHRILVPGATGWETLAAGTVIGQRALVRLPATTSTAVRVEFEADEPPILAEAGLHLATPFGAWGSDSLAAGRPVTASNVHGRNTPYGGDKAVDNDRHTRWATSDETRECWLEVDLQAERTLGRCAISELEPRIAKFRIEVRSDTNAPWQTACEGGKAGTNFTTSFSAVRARYVRLHILEATFAPTIWEFELFPPEK